MESHHKRVVIGLILVLGMLFAVPFGAMTFTGMTTATTATGQKPDVATPIFLALIVGCAAIIYYVYKKPK
ncbi:MAG: hypothetical protein EPN86_04070 [Nanoarchaeota archaeon]|nr:MAG: hypothetical protein EPN86_04070 [Nanoarchaeota archaeon]